MSILLKAENLCKTYNRCNVLNNVSINIESGEFCGILGQSGSGKSTLLYLLSGLEKPNAGVVCYDGKDLSSLTDKEISRLRNREFGFVFQFYNLIENLTVEENISFPLILQKKTTKEIDEIVNEIAGKVGLKDKIFKFPYELSGGEQQRVSIARALAIKPKIIFADEPTGNLDSRMGIEIMNLLADIHKKEQTTILMVTHNEKLLQYFDRTIKIIDGKVY